MNDYSVLLQKIENLEKRVDILEGVRPGVANEAERKKISLKEFLLTKKITNDVERTLAIGYYLEKYIGHESFHIGELEDSFKAAKEKIPQNMNDKVNMNIRKGHIMDYKEKKESKKSWCLTNSGETLVENNFKSVN